MAVTILYFASLREAVGVGEERLDIPDTVTSPASLIDWLVERSAGHAAAFAGRGKLLCAIDQQLCVHDAPLGAPKEIAFFPPVTGG